MQRTNAILSHVKASCARWHFSAWHPSSGRHVSEASIGYIYIYTQQTSVDSLIAVGWLGCKYHMPTKSTNVYNTTGWYWMKKESINCSKHYCEPWILMVTSILPHIGPMPRRHPFHLWRSCKQLVPCCLGCSNMGHICLWNIYRHVSESMLHKYNCHNGMYSTIHRYIAIQYSFWFCTYRTCSPIIHIQMYARVLES